MTEKQWKYRFYEEEELDIDDILDDTDDTDVSEDFSTDEDDFSSSDISSIISREINKKIGDRQSIDSGFSSDSSSGGEKDTTLISDSTDSHSNEKRHPSSSFHLDNTEHSYIPSHYSPHKSEPVHSNRKHKHKNAGGITIKSNSKRRVYKNLETLNRYPGSERSLVPFNHRFVGNYIIFSPITAGRSSDFHMQRILLFKDICQKIGYQYLPVYTINEDNQIIDIVLIVFTKGAAKEDYDKLVRLATCFGLGTRDYVGCFDGNLTLFNAFPIQYEEDENLNRVLNHYTRDRGIRLPKGARHFITLPKSEAEMNYRINKGEFCIPNPRSKLLG